MEILAIIPARGGSKGLPGKNIKPLLQHPLLAYSIKAAQESKLITRITVNTDDVDIAAVAIKYGATVPFMRPSEIAQDLTTDLEVFLHQLNWMKVNENYTPDLIVQLRPTSPIRMEGWIDTAINKLINSNADSLRAITESPITPFKMWLLNNNNEGMEPLLKLSHIKEPYNQPRQLLPTAYWQTGTIDIVRNSTLLNSGLMSGENIIPFIIPTEMAIDIDGVDAFYKAEAFIQYNNCIKFHE